MVPTHYHVAPELVYDSVRTNHNVTCRCRCSVPCTPCVSCSMAWCMTTRPALCRWCRCGAVATTCDAQPPVQALATGCACVTPVALLRDAAAAG